jgi:XisH protein
MPAKDIYHDTVKNALLKDGWTISHDPLQLPVGRKILFVDLGAIKLFSADKGECKIAVEVKSFVSRSQVEDLEKALGQYVLYEEILSRREPDRVLYLAISNDVFNSLFTEEIGQILLESNRLKLVVFNPVTEEITQWIP